MPFRHPLSRSLVLFALCLGLAAPAGADERWRELPPEARREMREQMRDHWRSDFNRPPPVADERSQRPPPGWRELPPDERRRLREEMRELQRSDRLR